MDDSKAQNSTENQGSGVSPECPKPAGRKCAKKNGTFVRPGDDPKVLSTVKQITEDRISGKMLAPVDRQDCVMWMISEGRTVPEIAKILNVSERTIERDKKAFRQRNALYHHKNFTPEIAGEMLAQHESSIAKVRRSANSKDAKPRDRIEAEKVIWMIKEGFVRTMHRLGYLPPPPSDQRLILSLE